MQVRCARRGPCDSLTSAVLSVYGVAVVTGGADVAVWPGCVVHAAQAVARQRVAVGEQHVGVCVAVATARLTLAAQHHGVAVVARRASAAGGTRWRVQRNHVAVLEELEEPGGSV